MSTVKNRQSILLGLFIFFGLSILAASVLILGGQKKTFQNTFTLNAIFDDVKGLLKGDNVWYAGVKIGTVKRVKIIGSGLAEVEMGIENSSKEVVFKDSRAKIGSDGLIGNRIVIIYGGTSSLPSVSDGDTLQTDIPPNTAEMMNTLRESNKNLSSITNDVKVVSSRLVNGEGTVGHLLTNDSLATQLLATVAILKQASLNIQSATSDMASYASRFQTRRGFANDLVTDTFVFKTLRIAAGQIAEASNNAREVTEDAKQLMQNATHVVENANQATNNVKQVSNNLKDSNNLVGLLTKDRQAADDLRTAIDNVQEGTKKFDENMEALRHNFLFRGFFKKKAKNEKKAKRRNQRKK